jgi:CcmD family protein
MPALPLHEAGKYVAGAYVVLFALILIYVAIMATRLARIERELGELLEITERSAPGGAPPASGGPTTGASKGSTPPATASGLASPADGDPLDVGRPQSTPA